MKQEITNMGESIIEKESSKEIFENITNLSYEDISFLKSIISIPIENPSEKAARISEKSLEPLREHNPDFNGMDLLEQFIASSITFYLARHTETESDKSLYAFGESTLKSQFLFVAAMIPTRPSQDMVGRFEETLQATRDIANTVIEEPGYEITQERLGEIIEANLTPIFEP